MTLSFAAVVARAVVLLAAIATAIWLVAALPGVRDRDRAEAIADRPAGERIPAADVERAVDLFGRARDRLPDGAVVPAEAGLLIRAGRHGDAERLLVPLVRDEPRNVTAWALLSLALVRSDPRGADRARARVRELAPPVKAG